MDGYDEMIKDPIWEKLEKAKAAAFDLQTALDEAGKNAHNAYLARYELATVENQLRSFYKQKSKVQ